MVMDVKNVFNSNLFISNPLSYEEKKQIKQFTKDIFAKDEKEINKEIAPYLDILYGDINYVDINQADEIYSEKTYRPMKSNKLHFGKFFI